MKIANRTDRFPIERVLTDIIDSVGQNLVLLQQKIVALGKEYFGSAVFPLDFVITKLETVRINTEPDNTNYIINIMRQIGVPWSILFSEYMRLYDKPDDFFRNQSNLFQLLQVIYNIIDIWTTELVQPTATLTDTRIFRECSVISAINKIETRLKTLGDDRLRKKFRALAERIERSGL